MTDGHGDDIMRYEGIRLNFSSNVYAHFDHGALWRHLAACLHKASHYPEPAPRRLEWRLAVAHGLLSGQVMATAGATEAIYLTAQAFRGCRSAIVAPTFSEYADACLMHGHEIRRVGSLGDIPPDADMVWLCAPNNPTGRLVGKDTLTSAIRRHPGIVFVLDASYADYAPLPTIAPHEAASLPNLLTLHSMTKRYAVPGLRLGYITADASLLDTVRRQRMPWSVSQPAQDAGLFLLDHDGDYPLPLGMLTQERERMVATLSALRGVEAHPSDCHIILCLLTRGNATELKEHLALRHGILIRDASNFAGLDAGHFRIAVQTPRENDEFLAALAQWLDR